MKRIALYVFLSFLVCAGSVAAIQTETGLAASTTVKIRAEAMPMLFKSLNMMRDRYEATIERLSSINARIVSRFEKMKVSLSAETTLAAQKSIDETRAQMEEAKKSLAALTVRLAELEANASTTANIRVKMQYMKKPTKEMELRMKNSISAMKKVLQKLQAVEQMKKASTTPVQSNTKLGIILPF